jgi:predicted MFS family arabinose efflux permease
VALAMAESVTGVVIARSFCAMGYAIATIACQSYMAKNTSSNESSARGLSVFVGTVTAACICGAPIGALIAELLSVRLAFILAAALTFFSWLLFARLTQPDEKKSLTSIEASETGDRTHISTLLKNSKLLFAVCCGVMPGKILLAGLLFYITPLLLQKFGLSQALIGQFFILYYFTLFIGNSFISRVDLTQQHAGIVVFCGGVLTGIGVLALALFESPGGLAIAIICLGCGQSIIVTPILSIVSDVAQREISSHAVTKALALARMFERVGGVIGVLLAAILSATIGYSDACVVLGLLCSSLACGLLVFVRFPSAKRVSI